jgi:hypothetical protein
MWILVAVAVAILIALAVVALVISSLCQGGGICEESVLGRAHGKYTIKWPSGEKLTVDGYVELRECGKCKRRSAVRWIDYNDEEHGGTQEIDVHYAEQQLQKAGILKKPSEDR